MPPPLFILFIPGLAFVFLVQMIICHTYHFQITYAHKKKKPVQESPKKKNEGPKVDEKIDQDESPRTKSNISQTKKPKRPRSLKEPKNDLESEKPSNANTTPPEDCEEEQTDEDEVNKRSSPRESARSQELQDFTTPREVRGNQRRKSVFAPSYDPDDEDADLEWEFHGKSPDETEWLRGTVKKLILFKHLADDQMDTVVGAMLKRPTSAGEYICTQGEKGDQFFVIQKGIFDVLVKHGDGKEVHVNTYEHAGSFGELALLYNQPRAATVVSRTDGVLWSLDGQTFRRIIHRITHQKRQMYEHLITNVPMLQSLELYERANLVDALEPKIFEDGQTIFKQDDAGDGMYFVISGAVNIVIHAKEGKDVILKALQTGDYFGELALVVNMPRAASAFAVGTTKLAFLDRGAFERLLGPCMEVMRRNIEHYDERLSEVLLHLQNEQAASQLPAESTKT